MTTVSASAFTQNVLDLDAPAETERLANGLRDAVGRTLHKRGAVVGLSGGIDSAVVLALAVKALSPDRVLAVLMPERDSEHESLHFARLAARRYGVEAVCEDITQVLEGFACYRRRDEAFQRVAGDYDPRLGHKAKIVLQNNLLDSGTLNVFELRVVRPDGAETAHPLPPDAFLEVVAASNFKQRTRMAYLYYHAERRNYAVIGTANRDEHDQGFFVKYGDGGVDVQPVQHLYKSQIFQLAEYLDVPLEIRRRVPTTDTYTASCSQEEFFFRLPFRTMDLLWYAQDHGIAPEEAAAVMNLTAAQVRRAYREFEAKRRSTQYLRLPPLEFPGPAAPSPEALR